MMVTIGICTRNNPAALAGLLSSLTTLLFPWQARPKDPCPCRLLIVDGSDLPVLAQPHLARLLSTFDVRYRHTLFPGLVAQRIAMLRLADTDDTPVLMLDDDHIYLTDPTPAFVSYDHERIPLFGASIDRLNDRGFPDYRFWSSDPHDDHGVGPHAVEPAPNPSVAQHTANAGHVLTCRGQALPLYEKVQEVVLPVPRISGAADDAVALALAGGVGMRHPSLTALHLGNSNLWWKGDPCKPTLAATLKRTLV